MSVPLPASPHTDSEQAVALLDVIEAVLDQHALGAFSGTESACVCDRWWRPNREYRHHVAHAIAAALTDGTPR